MSQTETLMVLALGAVLTGIAVLLLGRFFWGMALVAATRRRERKASVEILEVQAERDRMRAEHALMARKLDLRLDDIKVRMAEQMAEVSRNRNRVQGLLQDLGRKEEAIKIKERENTGLNNQIDVLRTELAAAHKTIETLTAEAQRNEEETARLQEGFRKMSVSLRDKYEQIGSLQQLVMDTQKQTPAPIEAPATIRNKVEEIENFSTSMKQSGDAFNPLGNAQEKALPSTTQRTIEMSAKVDSASRLTEEMEKELKSLDTLLAEAARNEKPSKPVRKNGTSNIISLAQRIRALQKGMDN